MYVIYIWSYLCVVRGIKIDKEREREREGEERDGERKRAKERQREKTVKDNRNL